MPSQRNQDILHEVTERLRDKQLIVTIRYSNVSASQMNDLRREVTNGGGNVYVAKNNLALIAAERLGISGMEQIVDGPTAYITASDDVAGAVKALTNVTRDLSLDLEILGGVMENELIDPARVNQISNLPSRDQLIGMLAATLNAPLTGLARVLNAPVQNLASALHQIAEQRRETDAVQH